LTGRHALIWYLPFYKNEFVVLDFGIDEFTNITIVFLMAKTFPWALSIREGLGG
jgi:hypothetical protein